MERGNSMQVQMPSDRGSPREVTWIDRRFSGRRREPRPARRRGPRENPGRARPRTRILVVDDDPGTLESYEGVLRDAGFDVATAGSASEALDIARDRRFDLSLVDLHLPDLSGLELIQRLGELHGDMTFVVVTGFGTAGTAVAAMKLGVADYVEKPLFGDALIDAVKQAHTPMRDGPAPSCALSSRQPIQRRSSTGAARSARRPAPSETGAERRDYRRNVHSRSRVSSER
jgi:ActR/RegA family two-component response regulator